MTESTPHYSQSFIVTLRQDLIVSSTAATAGQHETLDYLPGALFLGRTASRLYAELEAEDAWACFHSGAVRFGDALPLTGQGLPAWPMPLALHHYKGEEYRSLVTDTGGYTLLSERLFDPSRYPTDPIRQSKQLRAGYVTANGVLFNPRTEQHMKTAIDAATGRVAEGQLFDYEAITRGQRFVFTLEADASLDRKIFERLVKALQGRARLGRSRSAQFGAVDIEPIKNTLAVPASDNADQQTLTLWLLSDLALSDAYGQPALRPTPELLGLPAGSRWCVEHSFLRTRSYSPYNGKRRGRDAERQVICRGSILRYTLPDAPDTALLTRLAQGLGQYRETGLGRVAVNPVMLGSVHPQFASTEKPLIEIAARGVSEHPDSVLIRALSRAAVAAQDRNSAEQHAQHTFQQLLAALSMARNWAGVPARTPLEGAPMRSQWGILKQLANDHRGDGHKLRSVLFEGSDPVIRDRSGWQLPLGPKPGDTLGNRLKQELSEVDDSLLPETVGRLAAKALSSDWLNHVEGSAEENVA